MAKSNATELLHPLLEESTESTVTVKDSKKAKKIPWDKPLAVIYTLFLCWQLIGICLHFVRVVTCFKLKLLTYKCEANAGFPHSAHVEVCWLVTRSFHIIITIVFLEKFADFPGYKAICQQLKFLPEFWSLLFLLLVASSRYAIFFAVFDKALFYLIALYALNNILRVAAVAILNFTQLNTLINQSSRIVFDFAKLTLLVFFMGNIFSLVIALLEITLKIEEFSEDEMVNLTKFQVMYSLIHKCATSYFEFKIMAFFWLKLFADDKNLLSIHYHSLSQKKLETEAIKFIDEIEKTR